MENLLETINNPAAAWEERIDALKSYIHTGKAFPTSSGENNNHIHTIYSFSPYTPTMAALRAKEAGLDVAGSVDHDSISAAQEMTAACTVLHLGVVTGFEVRVDFRHTPFGDKKINNPDSPGIVYMTVQGVPSGAINQVKDFLKPIQAARFQRNILMIEKLNALLATIEKKSGKKIVEPLSWEKDVLPVSKASEGGGVTERHLLYAFAKKIAARHGFGPSLTNLVKNLPGVQIPPKIEKLLLDPENPHYLYDLLGLLKSAFLPGFFIQPESTECPKAELVTEFARSIGAIPAYAYLGDVGESPTGDKKAEKFEDSFLDQLLQELKKMGYLAITYMPPRNTIEQLLRLQNLCEKYEFMEISGVDINSSRQEFNCPEIRKKEFIHLIDATWALVAHEKLASVDESCAFFSEKNPFFAKPLKERVVCYSKLGRLLKPLGNLTAQEAVAKIHKV